MAQCQNPECGKEFEKKHKNHFYCHPRCKQKHYKNTGRTNEVMNRFNRSDKGKARSKKYLQSEKGIVYNRGKSARQRVRHPERVAARIRASQLLDRQSCSVEGCTEKGEGHHEDYSKPFDVIYFCKKHHMEYHYQNT